MSKHANHHKHKGEHAHGHAHKPKGLNKQQLMGLVAVGLMLAAMVAYVMSMDESEVPGEGNEPVVPADVAE